MKFEEKQENLSCSKTFDQWCTSIFIHNCNPTPAFTIQIICVTKNKKYICETTNGINSPQKTDVLVANICILFRSGEQQTVHEL